MDFTKTDLLLKIRVSLTFWLLEYFFEKKKYDQYFFLEINNFSYIAHLGRKAKVFILPKGDVYGKHVFF